MPSDGIALGVRNDGRGRQLRRPLSTSRAAVITKKSTTARWPQRHTTLHPTISLPTCHRWQRRWYDDHCALPSEPPLPAGGLDLGGCRTPYFGSSRGASTTKVAGICSDGAIKQGTPYVIAGLAVSPGVTSSVKLRADIYNRHQPTQHPH